MYIYAHGGLNSSGAGGSRRLRDLFGVRAAAESGGRDLELALFDVALDLVEARAADLRLPRGDAAVEDVVHFLEGFALGFGGSEEHLRT